MGTERPLVKVLTQMGNLNKTEWHLSFGQEAAQDRRATQRVELFETDLPPEDIHYSQYYCKSLQQHLNPVYYLYSLFSHQIPGLFLKLSIDSLDSLILDLKWNNVYCKPNVVIIIEIKLSQLTFT